MSSQQPNSPMSRLVGGSSNPPPFLLYGNSNSNNTALGTSSSATTMIQHDTDPFVASIPRNDTTTAASAAMPAALEMTNINQQPPSNDNKRIRRVRQQLDTVAWRKHFEDCYNFCYEKRQTVKAYCDLHADEVSYASMSRRWTSAGLDVLLQNRVDPKTTLSTTTASGQTKKMKKNRVTAAIDKFVEEENSKKVSKKKSQTALLDETPIGQSVNVVYKRQKQQQQQNNNINNNNNKPSSSSNDSGSTTSTAATATSLAAIKQGTHKFVLVVDGKVVTYSRKALLQEFHVVQELADEILQQQLKKETRMMMKAEATRLAIEHRNQDFCDQVSFWLRNFTDKDGQPVSEELIGQILERADKPYHENVPVTFGGSHCETISVAISGRNESAVSLHSIQLLTKTLAKQQQDLHQQQQQQQQQLLLSRNTPAPARKRAKPNEEVRNVATASRERRHRVVSEQAAKEKGIMESLEKEVDSLSRIVGGVTHYQNTVPNHYWRLAWANEHQEGRQEQSLERNKWLDLVGKLFGVQTTKLSHDLLNASLKNMAITKEDFDRKLLELRQTLEEKCRQLSATNTTHSELERMLRDMERTTTVDGSRT